MHEFKQYISQFSTFSNVTNMFKTAILLVMSEISAEARALLATAKCAACTVELVDVHQANEKR